MPAPEYPVSPRTDLGSGVALVLFGAIVTVLSWRMERLEDQGGAIYSAPGLWPGIIGLFIVVLGCVLALRSLRRARAASWSVEAVNDTVLEPRTRFALAVGLFFFYAAVLVGHGVPFGIGTAGFVAVYVYLFRPVDSARAGGRLRALLVAFVTGLVTSLLVVLVFEQLFYVRLP